MRYTSRAKLEIGKTQLKSRIFYVSSPTMTQLATENPTPTLTHSLFQTEISIMALGSGDSTTKKVGTVSLVDCGPHRTSSRSVSWNSTGSYLALASSDRMARIVEVTMAANTSPAARDILTVTGHTGPVLAVRFHPDQASLLCTAAADASVRLWDVRGATQRATGQIPVQHGQSVAAVEWCPSVDSSSPLLAVTERNGTVYVYDTRKLSAVPIASAAAARGGQRSSSGSSNSLALCTYNMAPWLPETCIFSPDGKYLVAGGTVRGEGMAELRIWPWKTGASTDSSSSSSSVLAGQQPGDMVSYPAHAGQIYSMQFSHDGKRLVTGGADAIVGLWDCVQSMVCTTTITRRLKFIRSAAFSHDSQLLAIATEEDGVDVADAASGALVGTVNLGHRPRSGGAEEVAWHPKEYILACARTDTNMGPPPTPVTVARLTITT
jgi:WD40 repeat protein